MSGQINIRVERDDTASAWDMLSASAQMAEQLWRLDKYVLTSAGEKIPLRHQLESRSLVSTPAINVVLLNDANNPDHDALLGCLEACRTAVLQGVSKISERGDVVALLREMSEHISEYQVGQKNMLVPVIQLDHDMLADILARIRSIKQLTNNIVAFEISGNGNNAIVRANKKLDLQQIGTEKPANQHKSRGIFVLIEVSLQKDVPWRGEINGRIVTIEIADKVWLDRFTTREFGLKHGDALWADFTRCDDGQKVIFYLTKIIELNVVKELEQLEFDYKLGNT